MNTCKSHYCQEGEQREICLAFSLVFCRFSKGAFCRKSPISMGKKDRLKPGKLLNLFYVSGIKEDSFQYHCFDNQGAGLFQTPDIFIDSPGIYINTVFIYQFIDLH